MTTFLRAYLISLACLLALDGPWLAFMGGRFYAQQIGHLMSASPQWIAAAFFYLLYPVGVTFLVVLPTRKTGEGPGRAFRLGALLGLVAYGAYDLTNQATLRDWPLLVTLVDLIWGTLLTGTVSAIATYGTRPAGSAASSSV